MIYLKLKGGLGNMLFQIAAGYSFAIKNNTELCFINLEEHLEYLNNDSTHQVNLKHAFEYLKLNQFSNKKTVNKQPQKYTVSSFPFEYFNLIPKNDSLIEDFFQSEKYFLDNEKAIKNDFKATDEIKEMLNKFDFFSYRTTAIHVRRGDYINFNQFHHVQSIEYYQKAIDLTKDFTEKFIIFSDDIQWCKNNFKGNKFIFIENQKDYIELYMMANCQNNIISNSSFSWWAAWLNENKNKVIIAPQKWFGPALNYLSEKDIIPEQWIKI